MQTHTGVVAHEESASLLDRAVDWRLDLDCEEGARGKREPRMERETETTHTHSTTHKQHTHTHTQRKTEERESESESERERATG